MTSIPWGALIIVALLGGMLLVIIRQAKSGAVNQYKANEAESIAQTNRMLNEAQMEIDRLNAMDKRERLRKQWRS